MLIYFRNREDGGKVKGEGDEDEEKSTFRKIVEGVPVIGSRIQGQARVSQIRQRSSAAVETSSSNGAIAASDHPYTSNTAASTANGTTPASETNSVAPITSNTQKKRKQPLIFIPETIIRPDVDPRAALVDKTGAIFGSIVMAATLATLVGTSVIGGVKVFEIAVPGAVLCFVRDGVADWLRWRKEQKEKNKPEEAGEGTAENGPGQTVEAKTRSRRRAMSSRRRRPERWKRSSSTLFALPLTVAPRALPLTPLNHLSRPPPPQHLPPHPPSAAATPSADSSHSAVALP